MLNRTLLLAIFTAASTWAVNLNNTVWNTNWNVMYFWQTANAVSGEYMYDGGILTGTISGDTLRGWWRESNNAKACGPANEWSGPVVLLFASDGKSFTGSWGYCGTDPVTLDPNGSGWTGTIKEGVTSYTQQECESAGRYWCNNACSITPCNAPMTQQACEAAGRFWCSDTCRMVDCSSSSTDKGIIRHTSNATEHMPRRMNRTTVDIRGRTVTNAGSPGVVIGPEGKSFVLTAQTRRR